MGAGKVDRELSGLTNQPNEEVKLEAVSTARRWLAKVKSIVYGGCKQSATPSWRRLVSLHRRERSQHGLWIVSTFS